MIEQDVIFSKINIIKNCIYAIERVKKQEKDPFFQQGLYELNLQRATQACIDMANVVIAKEGLGLPNSYRQSFEILAKHSILALDLSKKMVSMVGFRNISVHDYDEIKPEIVISIVENHLKDFEDYYTVIYNYSQKWIQP
ncbi:MAG: type VII toxin-antitoxin system HepT family RNase toxin [Pseudobdellovibrionaceae bacterium]